MKYENGFSVNYDLSWILPESFPSIVNQGIRLVGQEGMAEVDSQDRGYFSAFSTEKASSVVNPYGTLEYDHPVFGAVADGYTFESMVYFLDILSALDHGKSLAELQGLYPDGDSAVISTRIGVAIDRSIASGNIEAI